MTKWSCFLFCCIVLLIACIPVLARQATSETVLYDLDEKTLTVRLELNNEQIATLQAMLKMLHAQLELDRQNFATDAQALITAALRRAQMAENILLKSLNDKQKSSLRELENDQQVERAIFELTEGLCLTAEQTGKMRAILDVYGSTNQDDSGKQNDNAGQSEHRGGGRMGGHGGGRMGGGHSDMRASHGDGYSAREEEKEKAIAEILSPEQKKLFAQIKQAWRKERDSKHTKKTSETGFSIR